MNEIKFKNILGEATKGNMSRLTKQKNEKTLHIKIPKEMHDDLHTISEATGAPIAEIVRRAIRAHYHVAGVLVGALVGRNTPE